MELANNLHKVEDLIRDAYEEGYKEGKSDKKCLS